MQKPANLTVTKADALHPVVDVRIGVTQAGVRKASRKDLVVFALAEGCALAGVFTRNRFCAEPVQVCREYLAAGDADANRVSTVAYALPMECGWPKVPVAAARGSVGEVHEAGRNAPCFY